MKNAGNVYIITIIILLLFIFSLTAFGFGGFGFGRGGGGGKGSKNDPNGPDKPKKYSMETCHIIIDGNSIKVNDSLIKIEELIKHIDSLNIKDKTIDLDSSKSKYNTYVEIKKKLEDAKYILRESNLVQ